jgi:SNF family Na+-dependent transporter
VILAVAGSAVGLGNFLRFPGQAAQNGGGAFMLPYFISLVILGIPLCWAEWTMGRYAGTRGFNSAPGIFTVIWRNRLSKYLGGIALVIPLVIYMYYVLIEAWCLGYAVNYLTGGLMIDPAVVAAAEDATPQHTGLSATRFYAEAPEIHVRSQISMGISEEIARAEATKLTDEQRRNIAFGTFFERFVGSHENGFALGGESSKWLWVLAGVFLMNFYLIYRGVSNGIEILCKFAMPAMAVLAIIVLIRVLTLPATENGTVINGLGFMWNPNAEKIADPKTWLAAAGQIFFSLSVGFGIIVNYASYLSEKDDVALSGLTSSSVNEFFEVCLGGLITVPAAFLFLGAAAGGFSTFQLGFVALPNVFTRMWGGQVVGFLWFLMLFLAAITSSVSMLQPVIAFFEEGLGLKRHASATFLGLVAALGCGFVLYFSHNLVALDTFDFWIGSVLIFILAMIQAILYGWVFGIRRGDQEVHKGAHIRIPWFVQLLLKFVTPVYLLAIFVLFCIYNLPGYVKTIGSDTAALSSLLFVGVILVFLMVLVHIAGRRWELEGRFAELEKLEKKEKTP